MQLPPLDTITAQPMHLQRNIPQDYLDIFGHMNVQYYLAIANDAVFEMCRALGMNEAFFEEQQSALFALEQHLRYLAEVRVNERISVHTRLIARNAKRIHFMAFLVNDTQQNLAATVEAVAGYIDRNTRRMTHFPPQITSNLDKRLRHDTALNWPLPLAGKMGV